MQFKSALFALLLAVSCAAVVRAAQTDCRLRTVPVGIFTRDGGPRPYFGTSNFQAIVHGKKTRIQSITFDSRPRRIVLLLDASGSMLGSSSSFVIPNWDPTLEIADDLLTRMPPSTEIGLAIFASQIDMLVKPTTDRKMLTAAIEGLRSADSNLPKRLGGMTALLDSVKASAMFEEPRLGDAIYVITDGNDNKSKATPDNIGKGFVAAGVRLFSIILSQNNRIPSTVITFRPPNSSVPPDSETSFMERMTLATGGWTTVFRTPESLFHGSQPSAELRKKLDLMYSMMTEFYRVEIELPEPLTKPEKWSVWLNGIGKSTATNLIFAYPQMLLPCS